MEGKKRQRTAYGKVGLADAKEEETKWDGINMTFDYMGCLEQSSAMDRLWTPRCFHTATPQSEHTDQNNMAERWAHSHKCQQ